MVSELELASRLADTRTVKAPWPGQPAGGALKVTVSKTAGAIDVVLMPVMTA
jgi:hypothetical protein